MRSAWPGGVNVVVCCMLYTSSCDSNFHWERHGNCLVVFAFLTAIWRFGFVYAMFRICVTFFYVWAGSSLLIRSLRRSGLEMCIWLLYTEALGCHESLAWFRKQLMNCKYSRHFFLSLCFCLIWFGLRVVRRHGAVCGSSRPRGFVLVWFGLFRDGASLSEKQAWWNSNSNSKSHVFLFKASPVPRCFLLCCIGFLPLANSSTFLYESIDEGKLWRSSSSCTCQWVCRSAVTYLFYFPFFTFESLDIQ